MTITAEIFQAFLECETKTHLKLTGALGSQCEYSEWQQCRLNAYKEQCFHRLRTQCREDEYLLGTAYSEIPPKSQHRFALDCLVQSKQLQSRLHALERLAATGTTKNLSFYPIRLVPNEKVTQQDKLLLAFDALALAQASGKMPAFGKIVHGAEQKSIKVPLSELMTIVRSTVEKILAQQAKNTPPPLVLNKHCPECEFQVRCRQIAIEKDDLSLLTSMKEMERKKHHSKGIFTVTQLSYTFRPRRRPKKFAAKPENYHHSLKALAIREGKIHIAGKPELNITGTPVYLDVEGDPDRDFYYLIGLRVKSEEEYVQHSFWANNMSEERTIWIACLRLLASVENPQVLHYGSYETIFLKRMKERYGGLGESPQYVDKLIAQAVNVLSIIYSQIYFPTYSNGLKDIARYIGFQWTDGSATGLYSLMWRGEWEASQDAATQQKLITYNADDCKALESLHALLTQLCRTQADLSEQKADSVVYADEARSDYPRQFKRNQFVLAGMERINQCAYWDYQREKVYVRSSPRLKRNASKIVKKARATLPPNQTLIYDCPPPNCLQCGANKVYKHETRYKIVYDLKFTKDGVRRWITKYVFFRYRCSICRAAFFSVERPWTRHKYGKGLLAYVIYQTVELRLSQQMVGKSLKQLFGLDMSTNVLPHQRIRACEYHQPTYERLLQNIIKGELIHADETRIKIDGKDTYVWVLTNLEEVAYFHTDTREGETIQTLLKDFKGVLVSDFYAAYDAIECPQQKCLIHLMRDLNDSVLEEPFNLELKGLVQDFTNLVMPIVETIDRSGLKAYFLRKHKAHVERFFRSLTKREYQSEIAAKYKQRFLRNRDKLFTFLDYDGVPWNNNNAEHAIKAFATLRKVVEFSCSKKSIQDNLVLLSICETCKFKGISFLDFLRSDEQDIDEFIGKHSRKTSKRV